MTLLFDVSVLCYFESEISSSSANTTEKKLMNSKLRLDHSARLQLDPVLSSYYIPGVQLIKRLLVFASAAAAATATAT